MREFTRLHPAVDEQTVEVLLAEYLEIQAAIKPLLKRLEETKTLCKDLGAFATENFVVAIEPRSQRRLVSLEKAIEALGMETLEAYDLIQVIQFETVHISKLDK